jgi:S1-C subfamily serine protease
MKRFLSILLVAISIAACGPDRSAPPPQATAGTPARDLDVNTSFQGQTQPTPVSEALIGEADAEYLLLTNVYERVAPSVVNIEVTLKATDASLEPDGFGDGTAAGSGFVLDMNGHIATNAHVVSDADTITVTFNDGYVVAAELVGFDLFSDVAVIRVETDLAHLHPVTFSASGAVKVGERAIAIGNPFGLNSSMTVGIISGLGRQLPSAELISNDITPGFNNPSIIQVDTDINPGNSGGPLLNSRGEVIGINTAIRTESGIFEGVGFAVPAQTVQRVLPQLIEKGEMEYAWLGITSLASEEGLGVAALAEPLQLPVNQGVLIDTIVPESPAAKAGLQGGNEATTVRGVTVCAGGDIIVAVNGIYVKNMDELLSFMVLNTSPGDVLTMLVIRGSDTFELPLTLEARPTTFSSPQVLCGG